MRTLVNGLALAALTIGLTPQIAQAAPIPYTMIFDGSGGGDAGTGVFSWDDSTQLMTGLTWDFGAEGTGGVTEDRLIVSGAFLFNNIFNNVVDDPAIGYLTLLDSADMIPPFPSTSARFCWGSNSIACDVPDSAMGSYRFNHSDRLFTGYVTIAPAAVPEPGTFALVAAAAALIVRQRSRLKRRTT